jgi:hypothetical protein
MAATDTIGRQVLRRMRRGARRKLCWLSRPAAGRSGARVCGRTTRPWPGLLPALLVQTATHDEPTRSPALTQAAYAMTAYMRHESGGPMLYT